MTDVRRLSYQPACIGADAVEVLTFGRLRHLDDRRTQRGDFHVVAVVDGGHGSVTVDFDTYPLAARHAVWITPGAVHRWNDIDNLTGTVVLFVPTAPITGFARELAATSRLTPSWVVTDDAWRYVDAARTHLLLEAGADVARRPAEQLHMLLSALIARLSPPVRAGTADRDTFELFRTCVEANFRTHHDVNYYARTLGFVPRTITRSVQRSTGTTAKAFVVDRIILEAKRLLVHDQLSATRVAAELGFADPSSFSLFFRNATGLPPATWQSNTLAAGGLNTSQAAGGKTV